MTADDAAMLSVSRQSPTQAYRAQQATGDGNPFHITANASMSSFKSMASWDSGLGYREASPRSYLPTEELQKSWRAESISQTGKGMDSADDLPLYKTDNEFPITTAAPSSGEQLPILFVRPGRSLRGVVCLFCSGVDRWWQLDFRDFLSFGLIAQRWSSRGAWSGWMSSTVASAAVWREDLARC